MNNLQTMDRLIQIRDLYYEDKDEPIYLQKEDIDAINYAAAALYKTMMACPDRKAKYWVKGWITEG